MTPAKRPWTNGEQDDYLAWEEWLVDRIARANASKPVPQTVVMLGDLESHEVVELYTIMCQLADGDSTP